MKPLSFKRHRSPAEVIRHEVWLYFRFNLSLLDVEVMPDGPTTLSRFHAVADAAGSSCDLREVRMGKLCLRRA